MRILIEQHTYRYDLVKDDLWEGVSADPDGNVSFDYVGYFYNEKNGHCVLILPRVLLEDVTVPNVGKEERVFVEHRIDPESKKDTIQSYGFRPEEIIDPDVKMSGSYRLSKEQRKFIREFAVWVYRAIDRYWKDICHDIGEDAARKRKVIHRKFVPVMGRGSLHKSHTLLDVILALREFRKDNESFFLTVLRERESGFNKINWTRTVSKASMVMVRGAPLYVNPINRRREIDFDEELFVIYYSILEHVCDEYGFEALPNPGFPVLSAVAFRHYLNGFGKTRLKQIRGKYFSDRALKMWDLCYAFFEHQHEIRIQSKRQEYLLAKDFQIVFEAIIDDLIGAKVPDGLKEQGDGKRVDHIYRYYGLSVADGEDKRENEVYYIGDSKYYKRRTPIGDEAVYKQFTYARNVIQWNLNLFLDDKVPEGVEFHSDERKLRNDSTEGYAIVPNFFISARIDDDLRYDHAEVTPTEKDKKFFFARQFENRLFDRDTLLVTHYNVNFLFVLSLYARHNPGRCNAWRAEVKEEFRRRIRQLLVERFEFRVITPKSDTQPARFFKEHFRDLVGRVYDPYGTRGGFEYYSLALRKNDVEAGLDFSAENDRVLALIENGFIVSKPLLNLGTPPESVVAGEVRNPMLVMSSYNFEHAAKELSKGSYSITYATKAISAMQSARVFPCAVGVGIADHPEEVHTIFLFESGADNSLKAILQVVYLVEVSSREEMLLYRSDGIDCRKLSAVQTGGVGRHWLWRIVKWVSV